MRSGRRRRIHNLDISWRSNELDHPRLGLVVPRYGETVVTRNKLRRQLREIARRRILPQLQPMDLVVRPRAQAYNSNFTQLAADFERWLRSLSG